MRRYTRLAILNSSLLLCTLFLNATSGHASAEALAAANIASWRSEVAEGEVTRIPKAKSARGGIARMSRLLAVEISDDGKLQLYGEATPRSRIAFGLTQDEMLDLFASALRAELSGESPGVTIDEIPGKGNISAGDWLPVKYFGGVRYSALGYTLFEADRRLKNLSSGVDNVSMRPIQPAWHRTTPQIYTSLVLQNPAAAQRFSGGVNRLWFMPLRSRLLFSDDRSVVALDSPLIVDTETMVLRTSGSAVGLGIKDPSAAAFAQQLTGNYERYAAWDPVFVWLREASKLVMLAHSIVHASELGTDASSVEALSRFDYAAFLKKHRIKTIASPQTTPAITVPWQHQLGGTVLRQAVTGGVDLTPRGRADQATTDAQKKSEHRNVEVVTGAVGGLAASLDPNRWSSAIKDGKVPSRVVAFDVLLAEGQPGEQFAEVTDFTNGQIEMTRWRRDDLDDYRKFHQILSRMKNSVFVNRAESRAQPKTQEVEGSFGGGWELVAPQLALGEPGNWTDSSGSPLGSNMPRILTLAVPNEPPVVLRDLSSVNGSYFYEGREASGRAIRVEVTSDGYRTQRDGRALRFDKNGYLTHHGAVQIRRNGDGRISNYLLDGEVVRTFEYDSKGRLVGVRDANDHREKYRYENGRLAEVIGTPVGGDGEIDFMKVKPVQVAEIKRQNGKIEVRLDRQSNTYSSLARAADALALNIPTGQPGQPKLTLLQPSNLPTANVVGLQWRIQQQLAGRNAFVVSTRPDRFVQAYRGANLASQLQIAKNGKANAVVSFAKQHFSAEDQRTVTSQAKPAAFDAEQWLVPTTQSLRAEDVVVEMGILNEAWLDALETRGEQGDYRDKHVVLLLSRAESRVLEEKDMLDFTTDATAVADQMIDDGALLVTGYMADVSAPAGARMAESLGAQIEAGEPKQVDSALESVIDRCLEQQDAEEYRAYLKTFQQMQQNMFKRSENTPRRKPSAPWATRVVG